MDFDGSELIDDPQWVSCCVEKRCSFEDTSVRGRYVCRVHRSQHSCLGPNCAMIRAMASWIPYSSSSESSCPVTELLTFRREEVEFRGPYSSRTQVEASYGASECEPDRDKCSELRPEDKIDQVARVLKSCLPVMIALFSTILTEEFIREYTEADGGRVLCVSSTSWMARIFRVANKIQGGKRVKKLNLTRANGRSAVTEAVLKSVAAMATLFDSREPRIARFVKKMVCKYNDEQARRTGFYNAVIMVTLCFFPYLKHSVLDALFNNRTLVLMCFDKTLTRHNQWSTLASLIHLHVNRPEFTKRLTKSNLVRTLPIVVIATLEDFMSLVATGAGTGGMEQTSCDDKSQSNVLLANGDISTQSPLVRGYALKMSPREECEKHKKAPRDSRGKRRTPCSVGYYEADGGTLDEKVLCLRDV